MPLHIEANDTMTVVRFSRECLRGPNLQQTGEVLFGLAAAVGRGQLVLDFARVGSATSLVLGKMIALHKRVQAAGGRLTLVNLPPRVYEAFDITRLTRLFDIRPQKMPA